VVRVEHRKFLTKENISKGMDGRTDHLSVCSRKKILNTSSSCRCVARDRRSG